MLSESTPAGTAADDFEAIEKAVMESKRGRWFLDEYVKRRGGGGDSKTLLAAMGKLENAVAAGDALIAERLSKALGLMTSLDAKWSSAGVAAPALQLAPQHMKFFKQDEELFEAPAKPPAAEIRSVTGTKAEIAKGAKLVIRSAQTGGQSENASMVKESPPALAAETPPKSRIVIIRHNTSDTLDVPLHEELRASA